MGGSGIRKVVGRCPVSGREILTRPEWTDVPLGNDAAGTYQLLGSDIILATVAGTAGQSGIERFSALGQAVREDADVCCDRPVVIESWRDFAVTSRAAREAYARHIESHKRSRALIYNAPSPALRMDVRLAKRYFRIRSEVHFAPDYRRAVALAIRLLSERTDEVPPSLNRVPADQGPSTPMQPRTTTNPDWRIDAHDFSFRGERIGSAIVHISSMGAFREEHVEPVAGILRSIAQSIPPADSPYYIVMSLRNSKGTTQRTRLMYYRATFEFYHAWPFEAIVLYGVTEFVSAALNFNRRFLPFRVLIAEDLADALNIIGRDRSKRFTPTVPPPQYIRRKRRAAPRKQIHRYAEELLEFIGRVDSETSDAQRRGLVDSSHPFAAVIDAISTVKSDLDNLIADRLRTEAELEVAREIAEGSSRAKSDFLANMSHELRTPLNHIIGFAELVASGRVGDLNAQQAEYLNDAIQSSRHLLALINEVLDLSKVEAGRMEIERSEVNLPDLLENSRMVVAGRAAERRITLTLAADGIPRTILGDERRLRQILYNLLSNAVKFAPANGEVHVSATSVTGPPTRSPETVGGPVAAADTPHSILISVSDNGIGIAKDDLERIFSPFEQAESTASRQYDGTGLGLALSRRLVELHGGAIWAESPGLGEGSTFRFIIPA